MKQRVCLNVAMKQRVCLKCSVLIHSSIILR
jgi:hypothetical protein